MVSGSVSMLHCTLPFTIMICIYIREIDHTEKKWRLSLGISLTWGKEWHPAHQETCSPALTPAVTLSRVFPLRVLLLLPHIRTVRFPGRSNVPRWNKENVSLCCCPLFHYSFLFSCLKLLYFPSLFFSFFLFLFLGTVPPLSLPALPHGYSPSHIRCLHIFFLIT